LMEKNTSFRNLANSCFLPSSLCFSWLDVAPLAAEGATPAMGGTLASEDDGLMSDKGATGAADACGEIGGDSENVLLKFDLKKFMSCGRLVWFASCQSYSVHSDKSTLNFSDKRH
jgi:hypothetical protein